MSFFDKNKIILLNQYPGLFEELNTKECDDISCENIKIETTPIGEPTLCINGIYIHSQRDPLREGQRLAQTVSAEKEVVVILGFGLGYAAQAVAALSAGGKNRQIIVVEKHKNLLLKAFELRDFSDFLSKNRIIFVVGGTGEGITSALGLTSELAKAGNKKQTDEQQVSVIRNKALLTLDETSTAQWYRTVEDRIRTWTMRDEVNIATHKRFGKRWVRNLSHNKSAIRDLPGVSYLAGLAAGDNPLPVFLAAAGPSLDKIKPLLRDIYDRCIVVAVDTSYRFFVQNGMQPDFVVVVDPQFWNSRHLDRCLPDCSMQSNLMKSNLMQSNLHDQVCASSMAALIAESAVYPPVLNLPFKNKFLCSSLFPLGTFIEKQVDSKGRLGAGGSVATTAWDFVRTLGGKEIWVAGLDLAFPDLKTHFRGARFETLANSQSFRFSPAEKWVVCALRDGFPFKTFSGKGGQVLTDRRLSLYAAWFENQFNQHPQVQNYGFFMEGIAIKGLHIADTEKFFALPKRREEIDCRISGVYSTIENEFNSPEEMRKRAQRYDNAISVLKRDLNSIKTTSEKGADIARQALKSNLTSFAREKVLKELDKLTRRVTESEVKEVAGFLFPHVEEDKEERDSFRAYLKSSLAMFAGLAEAVELHC
jgi:hypothetical protein